MFTTYKHNNHLTFIREVFRMNKFTHSQFIWIRLFYILGSKIQDRLFMSMRLAVKWNRIILNLIFQVLSPPKNRLWIQANLHLEYIIPLMVELKLKLFDNNILSQEQPFKVSVNVLVWQNDYHDN